jgi:hypothetical protein
MLDSSAIHTSPDASAALPRVQAAAGSAELARYALVAAFVSIALAIRLSGLGAAPLAEDEINKLRAVERYDRGDLRANAEHPMLMKAAVWASWRAGRAWQLPPEVSVRLPNAIAGAALTLVLFLLATALFDPDVGVWAAFFWAFDVNAAAINRIAKEDTFLAFFLLLGAYLYERGKTAAARIDPARRERGLLGSAACFGLMLASKYMPHYFGLHALFNVAADRTPHDSIPDKRWRFFAVMGAVFVAANIAMLLPDTWQYVRDYAHGDTLRHTGYHFAGRVYPNTIDATPWGLPPTFYPLFFATKVPLGVLAAAAAGALWAARHAAHRGATFVRVFLVFPLLGYSLAASKFLRYMLPVLAVLDIVAAVGIVWIIRVLTERQPPAWRAVLAAASAACLLLPTMIELKAIGPYYGLHQNAIGSRVAPRGSIFPDDELYDAGVREAVEAIAQAADRGAVICSDATTVVAEYLARSGRRDIVSCSLSHDGLPMSPVETWVIVQESHTYFENALVIDALRRRGRPWFEARAGGVPAAQVFRFR